MPKLRDLADVSWQLTPPHSAYMRHGRVVVEGCQHVGRDHTRVGSSASDGRVVPFDFCLICTGTMYAENLKVRASAVRLA